MRVFKTIVLALLLTGCYTTNKAKKQVSKAHALKPNVTAELCGSFYPVKDSITKETVHINGKNDTITNMVTDTVINNDTTTIYKYLNTYINRTDTISKTHVQYRESTSKLKDLGYKIAEINDLNSAYIQENKHLKRNRNHWRIYFFILIAMFLLKIVITKRIF